MVTVLEAEEKRPILLPWVAGSAPLPTASASADRRVDHNRAFLLSPLPNPCPHRALQEIADTPSGDKTSLETRFMTILCTRSYPHLRRGEARPLPVQQSQLPRLRLPTPAVEDRG